MRKLSLLKTLLVSSLAILSLSSFAISPSMAGQKYKTERNAQHVQPYKVTGKALYFAKMLLPPDARLIITIEDSSKADAGAVLIMRKKFAVKSVPQSFAISFPKRALANGDLSLRAEIKTSDGRLWFVTDTHIPVRKISNANLFEVGEIKLVNAN